MNRFRIAIFALTTLALAVAPASAWGTRSHIHIANSVIEDLKAGRTQVPGFGALDLDPTDVQAILAYPDFFRGGAIAPDFLTSSFGTACTHNDDPVPQALVILARTSPGTKERAFALGWLCHVAGDAVTHDYTNIHTGHAYDTGDLENVRLHAGVEIFLDDEYTKGANVRFDVPLELIEQLYYSTNSEVFKKWAHAYRDADLIAGYQSIPNIRAWMKDYWRKQADDAKAAYDKQAARPWYDFGRYLKMALYWVQYRMYLGYWQKQETTLVAQPNLARSFVSCNAEFHRRVMDRNLANLQGSFAPFKADVERLIQISGSAPPFVTELMQKTGAGIFTWLDPNLAAITAQFNRVSLIEDARKAEIRAHVAAEGGFESFRYHYNARVLTLLACQKNGAAFVSGIDDLDESGELQKSGAYLQYPGAFKPFAGQPLPEIEVQTYGPLRDVAAIPHDQMALAGAGTFVEAKFELAFGMGFGPDLAGKEVEFLVDGKSIGKAKTDAEGIARLEYVPARTGRIEVEFRMTDKSFHGAKGKLALYVIAPKPTFIFDIDMTLSDCPEWLVPLVGKDALAFPHSVDFVKALDQAGFQVVYMTARDDALDSITRAFLTKNGFPQGPVFYNDWGLTTKLERDMLRSKNHGQYKARRMRDLMGAGIPIVAGVGNTPTDAQAYTEVGIVSYIYKNTNDTIPPGSVLFYGYQDLAGKVLTPTQLADHRKKAADGLQTLTFEHRDLDAGELRLYVEGARLWPALTTGPVGTARATIFQIAKAGAKLSFEGRGAPGDSATLRDFDVTDAAGTRIHDGPATWSLVQTGLGQASTITIGQ